MTKRKFYKSVIEVVVLHEEPDALSGDITLADIHAMITDGDCSGVWNVKGGGPKILNGRQMAQALKAQGSDPEFFQINDKGEDA